MLKINFLEEKYDVEVLKKASAVTLKLLNPSH
jgi:hypothetical protein